MILCDNILKSSDAMEAARILLELSSSPSRSPSPTDSYPNFYQPANSPEKSTNVNLNTDIANTSCTLDTFSVTSKWHSKRHSVAAEPQYDSVQSKNKLNLFAQYQRERKSWSKMKSQRKSKTSLKIEKPKLKTKHVGTQTEHECTIPKTVTELEKRIKELNEEAQFLQRLKLEVDKAHSDNDCNTVVVPDTSLQQSESPENNKGVLERAVRKSERKTKRKRSDSFYKPQAKNIKAEITVDGNNGKYNKQIKQEEEKEVLMDISADKDSYVEVIRKNSKPKEKLIPIGDGNAMVPHRVLKQMNWKSYRFATRKLLTAVFPRSVLATHSLTGKSSPAFPNKPAKKQLDPLLVYDIVQTVAERCQVSETTVRTCITTKLADECKMMRQRNENKSFESSKKENHHPRTSI